MFPSYRIHLPNHNAEWLQNQVIRPRDLPYALIIVLRPTNGDWVHVSFLRMLSITLPSSPSTTVSFSTLHRRSRQENLIEISRFACPISGWHELTEVRAYTLLGPSKHCSRVFMWDAVARRWSRPISDKRLEGLRGACKSPPLCPAH